VMLVAHVRHQGQADAAPQRSKERVPDAGALQRVGA
jgi:hypothetical protein